ncbi:hypothetical protein [Nocardioides sp.]|uniref:hypothetical protein n=1 Tax=Nocardioides sp. TaxID=35761 RepID=UPI0026168DEF|nr:hypothetical protein [Nocardioides sp.]
MRLWPMLAFGALVGLAVVLLWPSPPTRAPAEPVRARPEQQAATVLRAWDDQRARAWAEGDTVALARLYVATAPAREVDVRMLRRWVARGVRVQGLAMQVLSLRVLDHADGWWRLRVTDRVASADLVAPGRETELIDPEKPPGAARTRVLELRETRGTWQMVSVKDA